MGKRLLRLFLMVLFLGAFIISGCGSKTVPEQQSASEQKITITDMAGRQVSITKSVERVAAIGPGALRLYCYVNGVDKLAGVEDIENSNPLGRPYRLANPSLTSLPVIGPGGPNNAPDPEKLLAVNPDVIFSTYTIDISAVEELQAKTGIPVVALSYGQVSTFDPAVYSSLKFDWGDYRPGSEGARFDCLYGKMQTRFA